MSFVGGTPVLEDSTINSLVSICVSLNFINHWFKLLAGNFLWRCYAHPDKMNNISRKCLLTKRVLGTSVEGGKMRMKKQIEK